MDQALIENGQDNIDRDQCCQDQQGLRLQRILKRLRIALERRHQAVRNIQLPLDFGDGLDRLPQRRVRRQVEGQRNRRK